jgi:phosphoribosyl-AMP cyclohydrolase
VTDTPAFACRGTKDAVEAGTQFQPLFDANGLIAAVVSDWESGEMLMFAWMNREALAKTIASGTAHFWSRSRNKLWRKGEESGNTLEVREIRTDCDQDVVWLRVAVTGEGVACHTGRRSCFYRKLGAAPGPDGEWTLEFA